MVKFRQVCDKIGACRAISDSATCRSQNVLSGLCRLVCGGPRQFVGARGYLNPAATNEELSSESHKQAVSRDKKLASVRQADVPTNV